MRLRLGFAVAAHLDPDILIVDEVLAVGDAGFQKKCLNAMEGLRSSGRTVLFVSHNMAAVENLCTRALWIEGGRVLRDGNPAEIIKEYLSSFTSPESFGVDLSKYVNRRGSGEIRYTAFEVLSPQGEPLPLVRAGDPVVLRFHYHAKQALCYLSFGFRLFTELGTLVTDTSTWHHALDIPVVPAGDGYIDLEIDSMNLMAARYVISLWLTSGDGSHVFDGVENYLKLEIENANIYSSGRVLDSRSGIVFFPQRWRLHGLQSEKSSFHSDDAAGVTQTRDET
jgi:lipopolysaccharide transport system ATP-binding protein